MSPEVSTGPRPPAVREQQPGDDDEIRRLLAGALPGGVGAGGEDLPARGFVAVVSDTGPGESMSSVAQGRIVGYVGLRPGSVGATDVLVLDPLAVEPGQRHKGVGTYLAQYAVEVLSDSRAAAGLVAMDDSSFWSTFGFRPAEEVGVTGPEPRGGGLRVLSLHDDGSLRGALSLTDTAQ